MNNIYNNMISFDIETTGLSHRDKYGAPDVNTGERLTPRIWSMGIHNPVSDSINEVEFSSSNLSRERSELRNVDFYKNSKVWNDYSTGLNNSAFSEGMEVKGFNQVVSDSNFKSGVILIQNSKFEREWMNHAISKTGDEADIFQNLRYSFNDESRTRSLSLPPEVQSIRSDISRRKMSISDLDKAYDKIIDAYSRETDEAISSGKVIVADLMDFSGATLTKAVSKGYLPESFTRSGQNMEVLSRFLLGEEEIHSAGSDASQQSRVFKALAEIRERLSNDSVNGDDLRFFKSMQDNEIAIKELSSSRGILGLAESLEKGRPNLSGGFSGTKDVSYIDSITENVVESKVNTYGSQYGLHDSIESYMLLTRHNKGTSSYDKLRSAYDSFGAEGVIDLLKDDEYIKSVKNNSKDSEFAIKSYLTGPHRPALDSDVKIPEKTEAPESMYKAIQSKYTEIIDSDNILKNIMPRSAAKGLVAAGLVAGVGTLWGVSHFNSESRAQEFRDRSNRVRERNYNDSVFQGYTPMEVQNLNVGTAKYNWDNRNNHHVYGG